MKVQGAKWWQILDALFRVGGTNLLSPKLKKNVASRLANVVEGVQVAQKASGIPYPEYYIEPVLTLVESRDNLGGVGVLYARTVPLDANGRISIVVQFSAPLVLFGTKSFLRIIVAHEFLHYVDLVKHFSKMDIATQITSSSVFEETYQDASRALDPSIVYKEKKLISQLKKKETGGFTDDKLNEKIRIKWIEKGLPTVRLPVGQNQQRISIDSITRTRFEAKVVDLVSRLK